MYFIHCESIFTDVDSLKYHCQYCVDIKCIYPHNYGLKSKYCLSDIVESQTVKLCWSIPVNRRLLQIVVLITCSNITRHVFIVYVNCTCLCICPMCANVGMCLNAVYFNCTVLLQEYSALLLNCHLFICILITICLSFYFTIPDIFLTALRICQLWIVCTEKWFS